MGLVLATLSLVVTSLCGPMAQAQLAPLPTAEEVFDRFIEVTGGRRAYERIHTKVVRSRYRKPQSDQFSTKISYFSDPNDFYQITRDAHGEIRLEGVSGDVVWYVNPTTGPAIRTGIQRDQTLQYADLHKDENWRKYYKKAKCVSTEIISGENCYKVELTDKEGAIEVRYYSVSTGQHRVTKLGTDLPGGNTIRMSFYDYRATGELILPHRWIQSLAGMEIEVIHESIMLNVNLARGRFVLPQEVAALKSSKSESSKP